VRRSPGVVLFSGNFKFFASTASVGLRSSCHQLSIVPVPDPGILILILILMGSLHKPRYVTGLLQPPGSYYTVQLTMLRAWPSYFKASCPVQVCNRPGGHDADITSFVVLGA